MSVFLPLKPCLVFWFLVLFLFVCWFDLVGFFVCLFVLLLLLMMFSCVCLFVFSIQAGNAVRFLIKTTIKCDSSTQTDTHILPPTIVTSYEWNEWELRRKAIKLVCIVITRFSLLDTKVQNKLLLTFISCNINITLFKYTHFLYKWLNYFFHLFSPHVSRLSHSPTFSIFSQFFEQCFHCHVHSRFFICHL